VPAVQDVRVALRSLGRNPLFAGTAIATLALGIGLATAVFTVAEALLLRDLPVRDQGRLVVLWGETPDRGFANWPLLLDDAVRFGGGAQSLASTAFIAYQGAWQVPIRDRGLVSRVRVAEVSGTFFDVLGARPLLGRTLQPADDLVGAAPVVVLSHRAWRRHFGNDPDVLGRAFVLHQAGVACQIVGVMPPGLDYPKGAEVWAPLVPSRARLGAEPPVVHVNVVGRLRAGASASTARDELTAFFGRGEAGPTLRTMRGVAHGLPELVLGDARPALFAFSAASALLLLIACLNVANLLLVRGVERLREIAVRSALGASRPRLIALFLTEAFLLALVGGLLGAGLAVGAARSFVVLAPSSVPRLDEIHVDATALAAAVVVTLLTLLMFSIVPAVLASSVDSRALASGARSHGPRRSRRATEGFVVAQVTLAVVLLSAAGVIARSLVKLERADLAFEPEPLLIAELAVRSDAGRDRTQEIALLDRLLPPVRRIPGVRAVSPVLAVPFSESNGWDGQFASEGQPPDQVARNPILNIEIVEPDYFTVFGMPVLRGRLFDDRDTAGALPIAVISESTARHHWPRQDPIGKVLFLAPGREQRFEVVGVVADTRYRELRQARPSVYLPLRQSVFPFSLSTLAIRTDRPPSALIPGLRGAIGAVAPDVALIAATPFETFLDTELAQPTLNASLLAVFAAAAMSLAGVGLFGVMSAMVRQRTFEMGVRLALGARPLDVSVLVFRRGLAICGLGLAIGLAAGLWANRLLIAMLHEVTPSDPATLTGVVALIFGVAAVAASIPAVSIGRTDPMAALRDDG
jgi:predicted permease